MNDDEGGLYSTAIRLDWRLQYTLSPTPPLISSSSRHTVPRTTPLGQAAVITPRRAGLANRADGLAAAVARLFGSVAVCADDIQAVNLAVVPVAAVRAVFAGNQDGRGSRRGGRCREAAESSGDDGDGAGELHFDWLAG